MFLDVLERKLENFMITEEKNNVIKVIFFNKIHLVFSEIY